MSTNSNIDNLFAKKLRSHENMPSPEAWARLENQLNSKKSVWVSPFMKIAASILILLSLGTWIYFGNVETKTSIAYNIDMQVNHPKLNSNNFELSKQAMVAFEALYESHSKNNSQVMQPVNPSVHLPDKLINEQMQDVNTIAENEFEVEKISPNVLQPMLNGIQIADNTIDISIEIVEVDSPGLPPITVTYTGSEQVQDSSGFSFKRMLDSAKKLTEGGIIADIRGAKNEFLSVRKGEKI